MSEPLIPSRGGVIRLGALGVFALVTAGAAVVLAWLTSGWQGQVNRYWESQTGQGVAAGDPTEQAMEKLSTFSYLLGNMVAPLAVGALAAVFVSLAVLGYRWARQHPLKP